MEYKCTKCGGVITEQKDTCPNCGEKIYYCKHKNCGKQLFDANQKYCAYHNTRRKEIIKNIYKGVFICMGVLVAIPVIIVTGGKFNPVKYIKKFMNSKG